MRSLFIAVMLAAIALYYCTPSPALPRLYPYSTPAPAVWDDGKTTHW
jgi:hypothetical protein